ncbi:hypothetical protein R1sor_001162 [Riccia sorocarpa]|uniref:Uncharacterized protein n=1 Tax=Riccia sorocarpa TaxID=122646 RepID=A0ABD3GYF2_9MARC
MSSKGKEKQVGEIEEARATTPPRVQLDPNTMQVFETMRLFLQQQQAEEKKESHATKAFRTVVGSLSRFEGKNVSRFLKTYNMEMELNGVPEDEMIRSFELAGVPEMRDQVKTLITSAQGNWENFARAMREQFFLEDADRVTKRLFLDWVEKPNKGISANELLREFESQFSQLTRVEKMILEDDKKELFLRAADPELQEKLELRLEDNEAEKGLTTNWQRVKDAVDLLTKLDQRKEKGVQRPIVPRKDDPSLEEIMKGMKDLSLKLTRLEEKSSGDAAPKPVGRQAWVQRCIWCDGTDHARKECEDFSTMMGRGTIFWKDGKVALKDTGEELKTNFGKGGMKKLVEDYLAAHSVAAVEAACYGLSVEDGEDFTLEGYVKPSHLWKSAVASMKEEKTPIEILARTASTIRGETGWNDHVETLAIHAYIAKSQHEALVEEKRCRDDEGEGTSTKRQTRGEKAREQAPPPEIPMVDVPLSFDKGKKPVKEKGKGPAYKLQSDIEAATDLKAVLEKRVLDAEVKFSLRQILGIAKKEFHDIIIDIVKRKRQLTEDTAEALAHALGVDLTEDAADALAHMLGAKRDKKEDVSCCQQAPEKKKVVRVRFEDETEEENVVNPSHYTREHWARATGEAMVKLEGLDEPVVALIDHGSEINLMSKNIYEKGRWPIDTDHNWRIKTANNTHGGLLGACPG